MDHVERAVVAASSAVVVSVAGGKPILSGSDRRNGNLEERR